MIKKLQHKDNITYHWVENDIPVARLTAIIHQKDYTDFSQILDEQKFNTYFPNQAYIEIDIIKVDPMYRRKGIGNKLLTEIITNNNSNIKTFYLNAHPMGNVTLDSLVRYYKTFGFEIIYIDNDNSIEMVLNI